jgi:hypothetical protein
MAGQPPHFGWPTTSNVATSHMSPPWNPTLSVPPTRLTPTQRWIVLQIETECVGLAQPIQSINV